MIKKELSLQTTRARGLTPSSSAFCLVISTRAEAPSLRVLALAAVTVPVNGNKSISSCFQTLAQPKADQLFLCTYHLS